MWNITKYTRFNLLLLILALHIATAAQETKQLPYSYAKCATVRNPATRLIVQPEAFMNQLRERGLIENFTSPYYVRVFIRIVRETNGSLPGCTVQEALDNFYQMNGQYTGHNICFQLAGIDFINDSYLNNFNNSALLNSDYPNYIRNNNLDVDGAMTIFIHYNFLNDNGSSGNAYDLPNNFFSVARWAATGTDVNSIFGHEMGHCLGLFHTFDDSNGAENVTRNSANSCYNCDTDGDLCCDTPADYPNSQDNTSNNTCLYSGMATDACSVPYSPSTINIMSYQPWSCISVSSTALTPNQRSRMHASILDPGGPIYNRVSEDNLALGSGIFITNQVIIYGAKNTISTNTGSSIIFSSDTKGYFTAGSSISFGPGVQFIPGSAGLINASINGCN